MTEKMDKIIAKCLSVNKKIDCIIYVGDLKNALKILHHENIKINGVYAFINAISITVESEKLQKILTQTNIQFVSAHCNAFAMMNISRQILGVGQENFGEGLSIAYVDTGIFPHLDFTLGGSRILQFVDLINYRVFPYDDNGHGTFVAGVGSGNGLVSNKKYAGICPKSNIIAIKALNAEGEANANKILEAMQWIYDNSQKFGIKVVCMSFGSEPLGENDPIMRGADALWASGITVVAAAGNSGPEYQTIKSPGISKNIITVGGLDDNRIDDNTFEPNFFEIAEFSSRGPALGGFKPDLVAPAVDIISCGIKEFYTTLSGTSVATPMVAGLATLLLEQNPKLSPDKIKQILQNASLPITFNQNKEGFGCPNLANLKITLS